MFRIEPNPTFKAEVKITAPGRVDAGVIEFEFRHKSKSEVRAWLESALHESDVALLGEVIVGWSGVEDAGGADLEYSEQRLAQLLDKYPAAAQEIVQGYLAALSEGRVKNSGGSLVA